MTFDLASSIQILERTPSVLDSLLGGLSETWTTSNEGGDSWSPFDIVGHLIHGEQTDWIQRMEIILSDRPDKTFVPFDRFAQFRHSKGKSLRQLLDEFTALRAQNLNTLRSKKLDPADFQKRGVHPELGPASLSHLLASWVVHDLNHLSQISRVMANQYREEVGPWKEFMGILNR